MRGPGSPQAHCPAWHGVCYREGCAARKGSSRSQELRIAGEPWPRDAPMRKHVAILGASRVLDYSTLAGVDFNSYAIDVARDTGRVLFGQLWMPDANASEILYAVYAPRIREQLNSPNTLLAVLR